jgi:signal transduction histidine kinase
LTILNDILDLSKIESGKLVLDPVPFRLTESLEDALKPHAVRARAKGLDLPWRVLPDVPESLRGDWGRLRQVLVNLVGNAVKFTERGGVAITVRRQAAGNDQSREPPPAWSNCGADASGWRVNPVGEATFISPHFWRPSRPATPFSPRRTMPARSNRPCGRFAPHGGG